MPITPRELVSWSRQDNVELYRGDNQQHVDTKTGWFGGRMARNHKIKSGEEDRTLKQQAYKNAQDDVFSALERIYGKEIATKAWRANIGKTRVVEQGDERVVQHGVSRDRPITGRHIRKMIDTAEKLLKQDVQNVQRYDRHELRNRAGLAETGKGVAAFMLRHNPDFRDMSLIQRMNRTQEMPNDWLKIGNTEIKLKDHHVGRFESNSQVDMAVDTAEKLRNDITDYFDDAPGQRDGYWTLDIKLPKNMGGRDRHFIGVRAVKDSDMIEVFDANSRDIKIPKDEFPAWLSKHLKDKYGEVNWIDIYRPKQVLSGKDWFVANGGKWDLHREIVGEDKQGVFDHELKARIQHVTQGNVDRGMYWQFWSDVDRDFSLQVDRGDSQLRVTSENAIEEMTSLVSLNDDNDVGDANARKALSSLLNQKIGVELFTQARGAMPWTLMTPTGSDEGVL